ncbi:unnamed protein product, partial [Effrenium voratum]
VLNPGVSSLLASWLWPLPCEPMAGAACRQTVVAAATEKRILRPQGPNLQRPARAAGALLACSACIAFTPCSKFLSRIGKRAARKAASRRVSRVATPGISYASRWQLAAKGTPRQEDDPDGELRKQVEHLWEDLEPKLMYLSRDDRLLALSALCVAALAHKGQTRKSGEPYIVHPVAVAELLALLKVQAEVIVSGLLHDTVEDNATMRFEDLEGIFGPDVRRIVEGETKASKRTAGWSRYTSLFNQFLGKPPSPPEVAKAREQAENLRDMFLAMADDYRVILVKLADRLHNMRTLEFMREDKQKKIAAETLFVFAQLAHRLGVWLFKTELEDLSFKYLYPTEFQKLNKLLSARRAQYESTLQLATSDCAEILRQDATFQEHDVRIELTGKEKGLYSLWEKMRRKRTYLNNIDDVADVIALHVVLDIDKLEDEDDEAYAARAAKYCYHALGLVRKLPNWSGGDCVKDYIRYPKPNGYQSLHVTFIHEDSVVPLELQIRTRRMHEVAEYGICYAHWNYEDRSKMSETQSRRVTFLDSLADKDRKLRADPLEFVQEVLRDELGKRCFVILGNGTILELSRGCTALDAAFKIHEQVGLHMLYPVINDKKVSPFYLLQNGDRVQIVTSQEAVPKREWLACAFLHSTRQSLKAFFDERKKNKNSKKDKERAVDVAAALATAATAAAALPLVH